MKRFNKTVDFHHNNLVVILLLSPVLLLFSFFVIIPIIATLYFSLCKWDLIGSAIQFNGFKNYMVIFQNNTFLLSIKNVLWFVLLSLLTQIPIAFTLAFLLCKIKRGVRFIKTLYFLPIVLPIVAVSLLWNFIFLSTSDGILNQFLHLIGLGGYIKSWLADPKVALNSVIAVATWGGVGNVFIIAYAAILNISEDVLESASIDGASEWRKVFSIQIPMIWETMKIIVIFIMTQILRIFDIIYVMTNPGPSGTHVPATLSFDEAFQYMHYGTGSAIAVVLLLMSLAATGIGLWIMKKGNY